MNGHRLVISLLLGTAMTFGPSLGHASSSPSRAKDAQPARDTDASLRAQGAYAPAPAMPTVVPPPVIVQNQTAMVVRPKPPKLLQGIVGLGVDIFPLDLGLSITANLAWEIHGLLFAAGAHGDTRTYIGFLTGPDWYFKGRTFRGFYLAARAGLVAIKNPSRWRRMPSARLGAGYKWVFDDLFLLSLEGGFQYLRIPHDDGSKVQMLFPYFRLSGGLAF